MSQVILQGYGDRGKPVAQGYAETAVNPKTPVRWYPGLARPRTQLKPRPKGR
jgi:hypothetical protein